jgi:hypothetical protein
LGDYEQQKNKAIIIVDAELESADINPTANPKSINSPLIAVDISQIAELSAANSTEGQDKTNRNGGI